MQWQDGRSFKASIIERGLRQSALLFQVLDLAFSRLGSYGGEDSPLDISRVIILSI